MKVSDWTNHIRFRKPSKLKQSWMLESMGIIKCACSGPAVHWENTWIRIGLCQLLEIGKGAKCMPGLNQSDLFSILKTKFVYDS